MHAFVSDRSDSIDLKCVIREFSKGGCRITSSYVEDLPRVIEILPEGFEAPLTGKIVWRDAKFAGVQFISDAEAGELERNKPVHTHRAKPAGFFARLQSFVTLRRSAGLVTAEERPTGDAAQVPLTTSVLHVLHNPLTAMKGLLSLLIGESYLPLPRRARSVIKAAYLNAEKAEKVVEEALHAEQMESSQLPCVPEPIDIVELANNVLLANTGFAALHDVRFEMNDDVGQATVKADAQRLEEVIGHLLAHAANSAPKGEMVTLSLSRNEDLIRLAVSDGGLGTPVQYGDADGKPAVDELADKTSQWLRICHAILKKHGSSLQIDSRPGSGSTAWFELKESA